MAFPFSSTIELSGRQYLIVDKKLFLESFNKIEKKNRILIIRILYTFVFFQGVAEEPVNIPCFERQVEWKLRSIRLKAREVIMITS